MNNRFDTILEYARPDCWLYDLCCDHGLIGMAALQSSARVVCVDQSSQALARLRADHAALSESDRSRLLIIESAAEHLQLENQDCDFVIAGVGTFTMITILDALLPQEKYHIHRWILAPQKNGDRIRAYMQAKDYPLIAERVVMERGRMREVLVYQRSLK